MAVNSMAPDVYSRVVDLTQYIDSTPSTWGLLAGITPKGEDNKLVRVNRKEFLSNYGEPSLSYTGNAAFAYGPYVAESFLTESDTLFFIRVLPDDAAFSNLAIKMYGLDQTGVDDSQFFDSTGGTGQEDSTTPFEVVVYPDYYTNVNTYAELQTKVRELDEDVWYDRDPESLDATGGSTLDVGANVDATLVLFYGAGRGSYYNDFQIDCNRHPDEDKRELGIYVLDIYKRQRFSERFSSSPTNSYSAYADYEIVESYNVSFDPDSKDQSSGLSNFIEDMINESSKEIRVICNHTILKELFRRVNEPLSGGDQVVVDFSKAFKTTTNNFNPYDAFDISGIPNSELTAILEDLGMEDAQYSLEYLNQILTHGYSLRNGHEGSLFTIRDLTNNTRVSVIDSTVATNLLARAYTGNLTNIWIPIDEDDSENVPEGYVNEVLDTEFYPFDVVFDAGYPQGVKDAIQNLVNNRRDCIAFIDNGDHKTAVGALKTRNVIQGPLQTTSGRNTSAYNSRYVSLYEPYTKIYDVFSGRDIWVPPTYHLARIIGFSDKSNELWYPLAGFQRATITNIKNMRYVPSNADRDQFTRQQINPIARFSDGFAVFGQRTTQRRNSVTQDLNVVRLVLYIERAIKRFCRPFIFELNEESTWTRIRTEIDRFLKDVQNRRGLRGYSVAVGATEMDMAMRRCTVDIILKPTRAIEQIHLNFYITD